MSTAMNAWRAVWSVTSRGTAARSERGAAAVEFALIIPVILAALTGIANYGLAMYNKMELVSAARAGAQQAILAGDNSTTADLDAIKSAVVSSTNVGVTAGDVSAVQSFVCLSGTLDTTSTPTCGVGQDPPQYHMTVTVSQVYTLLLLGTNINLSGSVTVRTK